MEASKVVECVEKFLAEVVAIREHLGEIADAMYDWEECEEGEEEGEVEGEKKEEGAE